MDILYPLLCYYPSEVGGQANTIYWLNKSLGKNGFQSTVISTDYGLRDHSFDTYKLFEQHKIFAEFVSGTFFSFFLKNQMHKLINTDVVHLSSLFFKPTLIYLLLCLFLSKRIIISPRGELYKTALLRKKWFKIIYLKIIKIFQEAIEFHSTNNYETKLIKRYFPKAKNIVEIPNFIELSDLKRTIVKNQFLYLGRINPIKNIHILIKAFRQLPVEQKTKFSIIIAGEALLNYEKVYLNELVECINKLKLNNSIKLIGGIYGAEKQILLSESYCVVLPSKSENFGNVILEALCQGVPVIVSKNAPWEIIAEYNAGYWVEPTIKSIKNAMIQILSLKPNEHNMMKENALNLAASKFDINQNIYQWINFYTNTKETISHAKK